MKEGYKQTELGLIPDDWTIIKLENIIINSILGGNYENGESEKGLPLIKMGNIGRGKINLSKIEYVPDSLKYSDEYILKEGDLLLNTRNTLELVGKVAIWRRELKKALFNSNLLRIEFDPNYVANNYFMNYVFNSEYGIAQLRNFATGTTSVAAIYNKDLNKFKVILPSTYEQQKIAEILSSVDDKIDIIEEQIKETQKLKKGLMQSLLTKGIGHTKLKSSPFGEIPESWEVIKIEDLLNRKSILSHLDGNHGELYPKSDEFVEEGIPYVSANSFVNGKVNFLTCKKLSIERASKFKKGIAKDGDVLFAHNATVGPVAFLETNLDFVILSTTATYYRLDNKSIDSKYWMYFLASKYFSSQYKKVMGQSTRNQVPITTQRSFIACIPTFKEQIKISSILSSVDEKLEVLQEKKSQYIQLKKGLMQQLLTGKMRVNHLIYETA